MSSAALSKVDPAKHNHEWIDPSLLGSASIYDMNSLKRKQDLYAQGRSRNTHAARCSTLCITPRQSGTCIPCRPCAATCDHGIVPSSDTLTSSKAACLRAKAPCGAPATALDH